MSRHPRLSDWQLDLQELILHWDSHDVYHNPHTQDPALEPVKNRLQELQQQGHSFESLTNVLSKPITLCLVEQNRVEMLKLVMSYGCPLDTLDAYHNNAVHLAAASESVDSLLFCLKQGISPHAINKLGHQPLACAANEICDIAKAIRMMQILIDAQVDINHISPADCNFSHYSALRWLIDGEHSSIEPLEFLMQQPELNIDNVNGLGDSALHLASARGSLQTLEYLVNTGRFDLDQKNDQGLTALDQAATHHNKVINAYLAPIYAVWEERKLLQQALDHIPLGDTTSHHHDYRPEIRDALEQGEVGPPHAPFKPTKPRSL